MPRAVGRPAAPSAVTHRKGVREGGAARAREVCVKVELNMSHLFHSDSVCGTILA